MALPQKKSHAVTLAEASLLTANFRKRTAEGAVKGGMFWKEAVEKVIGQPGCVGMRYYYGQQDDGKPVLVLVGVDAVGRDITEGFIAELSSPCPPYCDEPNPLNRGEEFILAHRGPIRYKARMPERETAEVNTKP